MQGMAVINIMKKPDLTFTTLRYLWNICLKYYI